MVRRLPALLVAVALSVLAVGCTDPIPTAPPAEEISSRVAAHPLRQEAAAALLAWGDGLESFVFESELEVDNDGSLAYASARVHRLYRPDTLWIEAAELLTDSASFAFQLLIGPEESHLFLADHGWRKISRTENGSFFDFAILMFPDAPADAQWLTELLRCADHPIGSLSVINWRGESAWDLECSGATRDPPNAEATVELIESTLPLFDQVLQLRDDSGDRTDQSGVKAEEMRPYLRLIVARASGALLEIEVRIIVQYSDKSKHLHWLATLLNWNEPITFPTPSLQLRAD